MDASQAAGSLAALRFENTLVTSLPADPREGGPPRPVEGAAYSRVKPRGFQAPRTLAVAGEVAELLGLEETACTDPDFAEVFSGNRQLPGMDPYALCYGGHQFGNWAGQLGDGRAINLGQAVTPNGRYVLQLKGAGPTPYSRRGDGLAVLRSSVREFLCSEAMHHLGVPTTRALSLVGTGEEVLRDMFYDGNPRHEPGAVVCRVSRSFLRLGSFELPAARGDQALLRQLAEYSIRNDYPELDAPLEEPVSGELFMEWFERIAARTADLVVHWMRVGFVHGVLNTDNLSVLGETIDYGPYGWVEDYDETWTPNTTDAQGRRYRFGNQAAIAHWNLVRMASAIVPLVGDPAPLQASMDAWPAAYAVRQRAMLESKLGLAQTPSDSALVEDLGPLLSAVETDMTLFYRALAELPLDGGGPGDDVLVRTFAPCHYQGDALAGDRLDALRAWCGRYAQAVEAAGLSDGERAQRMNAVNPLYVLRNYLAQLAIDRAEKGDSGGVVELLEVLRNPYSSQSGAETFAEKRPEWARHRPGCSMLSCSS